ncbi:hypothetical protein [Paracoccus sp. N5]|uniref:hypothetical protein n=1 Tax=Paracoccus sp. N5 TaxID=1101189 RepID=UPI00035D8C52|nr:hypothetical protein [Paracoccus sp. N5]
MHVFFIHLAQAVAWIGFVLGSMRVVMGFALAEFPELWSRYLGNGTSGEVIDKGILTVLVAIGFGVLAQIGSSVAKMTASRD